MAYSLQTAVNRPRLRLAVRLIVVTVILAVVAIELDAVAVFLLLRSVG